MQTKEFNYDLPSELIAQHPEPVRDASRLLVLNRSARTLQHKRFPDLLSCLRPGDALILNNSKVIPARLRAFKPGSNGAVEVFLVEEVSLNEWWTLLRPGKRAQPGTILQLRDKLGNETALSAKVLEKNDDGRYRLRFFGSGDLKLELDTLGEVPLPPYIAREKGPETNDPARYQTVYAGPPGSVAAPTAGLHFTPQLLDRVRELGVNVGHVTLHVGLGTFAPVKAEKLEEHKMHAERFTVPEETAALVEKTKGSGGRVFAAGTTSLRVLESAAGSEGHLQAGSGQTRLFVYPPYRFRFVDALITNFHLPESTLLMLVSAFAAPGSTDGIRLMLDTYAEAVRERYRFFSYGDAMLIL